MSTVSTAAGPILGSSDFSVLVAYSGPEDKPFYRARLVSASRASLIEAEPFWGYAVIGPGEFKRLVGLLSSHDRELLPGPHPAEKDEYYVEIDAGGDVFYCSLGFEQATVSILNQVANVLEVDNRKPILDIISRLGSI